MKKETSNSNEQAVDIEALALKNELPPKGRKYRIKIGNEMVIAEKECMTGREILALVNQTPEEYTLRMKVKQGNQQITIAPDQMICFTDERGIEKFKTLIHDVTDGGVPRRDFSVLEEDAEFLDSLQLPWETVNVQGVPWVFIHGYKIPAGYNVQEVAIGVRITPSYPTAQLDMLYFYPALNRIDGKQINNLTTVNIDNKEFQQWSRHRTGNSQWRVGVDNLSTHIPLTDIWFAKEFVRRPSNAVSA